MPGEHDAELAHRAELLRREYKRSLGRPPSAKGNRPAAGLPGHSGNRASFWRDRSGGKP
jgi:hypothetical protein